MVDFYLPVQEIIRGVDFVKHSGGGARVYRSEQAARNWRILHGAENRWKIIHLEVELNGEVKASWVKE